MADLPNLDAARAALAKAEAPRCGAFFRPDPRYTDTDPCGLAAGHEGRCGHRQADDLSRHLRTALAAVDALAARLAEAEAENRRLRDVLGWTNQECPGKCGAAAFDALAAKVTPFLLPCPTCGYNGVPGTTHSTSCLYPEAKVTP